MSLPEVNRIMDNAVDSVPITNDIEYVMSHGNCQSIKTSKPVRNIKGQT
jgi:hypothetical protein